MSQTKAQLVEGLNINPSAPASALSIDASGNINLDSNTLYVDASTNRVGLGTSSADGTLHVQGSNSGATLEALVLRNNNTASGSAAAIRFTNSTAAYNHASIIGGRVDGGNLDFYTAASANPAVRIDASSRVGIGTQTPQALLSFGDSIPANGQKLLTYDSGNTRSGLGIVSGEHRLFTNTTSVLSFGHVSNSDGSTYTERARIDSSGRLLVGTYTSLLSSAYIQSYRASGSNYLLIDSDSLANTEVVACRAAGGSRTVELGVYKHSGITNPSGYMDLIRENGTPTYYWTDNSTIFRISSNAANIGTTGGAVVGTQTSDERIKNILGPVEYGLDTLKQIEPVRYSLKSEPEAEKLGFIAQQVQPLVPESVFDTKEHIEGEPEGAPTKLGMEYVSLIPVLVNAIKELSAEVDALKAQLQAS